MGHSEAESLAKYGKVLTLEDREVGLGPAGPSLTRVCRQKVSMMTSLNLGEPAKAAVITYRSETEPESVYLCSEPKMISTAARSSAPWGQ